MTIDELLVAAGYNETCFECKYYSSDLADGMITDDCDAPDDGYCPRLKEE